MIEYKFTSKVHEILENKNVFNSFWTQAKSLKSGRKQVTGSTT